MYRRNQIVFKIASDPKFVYIVKSGEFEIARPIIINDKQQNFNLKIALLGKGEIFGEEEIVNNKAFIYTCTCYSTFGELYCISKENFMLRFNKQSDQVEEVKRSLKYLIRENRIDNFKKFFNAKTQPENKPIEKKLSPPLFSLTSKRSFKTESNRIKFSPFNKNQLESIKRKALGLQTPERLYININSPMQYLKTEEPEDTSLIKNNKSFFETSIRKAKGFYSVRKRQLFKFKPKSRSFVLHG